MLRARVIGLLCVALLAACQAPPPIVVIPASTAGPTTVPTVALIRVYVSGAVARPNEVYLLPEHSIGQDAVRAAGGATSEADLDNVNLALELHNHTQFHVPRKNEPAPAAEAGQAAALPPGGARININTATAQELDQLPKIGPATAQQIIEYRTRNGRFKKIDEITNVKGIGDATFIQIKDLITVED